MLIHGPAAWAFRFLSKQACIIAAWGEQGAYGLGAEDELCHAEAMPPEQVVDTLGAGDTFNAAVIDGAIRKTPMPALLLAACELAGRKCGRHGFELGLESD